MADIIKDLNQNGLSMKKLKRILDVLSVVCAIASINMIVACQYKDVLDILGFKSYQDVIFDLAFSLLVTSIILSTLGMATSRIQDRKLEIYFSFLKISKLFRSLQTPLVLKSKDIGREEKSSKATDTQSESNQAESIRNLKEKRGDQDHLNSLDDLSIKKKDAENSKDAKKCTTFSTSNNKSSEINNTPELQKCHTPFSFGHCGVSHSPILSTKRWKFPQFDLKPLEKESQWLPLLKQTFVTNGHFNEVEPRNISDKNPQVGIVSPIKINDSNNVKYSDVYNNISPSVECIQSYQKLPKKRVNQNSLGEQHCFYQDTGRMSGACFKVEDNILYENNTPIRPSFYKFPECQREVFNSNLQTTHLKNLHKLQNKFHKTRSHDSRKINRTILQTTPESSYAFTDEITGIEKFSLQKRQEVKFGDHCHKFHQNVTPNLKSFHPSSRDFKEALNSQIGIINPHYKWNINSNKWIKSFVERPDIPMEICDKAPSDQVLEVSMKLNDFKF